MERAKGDVPLFPFLPLPLLPLLPLVPLFPFSPSSDTHPSPPFLPSSVPTFCNSLSYLSPLFPILLTYLPTLYLTSILLSYSPSLSSFSRPYSTSLLSLHSLIFSARTLIYGTLNCLSRICIEVVCLSVSEHLTQQQTED